MVIHTVYIYIPGEWGKSKPQAANETRTEHQVPAGKKHTPNDNFKCYLKRFEKTRALWNESLQTVVLSLPALNVLSR